MLNNALGMLREHNFLINIMALFDEQIKRKPAQYAWAQKYIDSMNDGHWTVKLFNFQSDIQDFKVNMSPMEKQMTIRTLCAIGQVETEVKRFWPRLGEHFPHHVLYDLGFTMASVEAIHGRAYERLLEVLGLDHMLDEIMEEEVIKNRVAYLGRHRKKQYPKDQRKQYVYDLILFTIFVENVSLFSQFYIINWLNRYRNVLKDTAQQTQYTRNEETIHAMVGMKLVNTLREEYPEYFDEDMTEKINGEIQTAFESECAIVDWIVGDYNEKSLNADLLKEFIKSRMNYSLKQMGFKKVFKVNKALRDETKWFDEEVYGNNMSDFFHTRPVEYAKKNKSFNENDLF